MNKLVKLCNYVAKKNLSPSLYAKGVKIYQHIAYALYIMNIYSKKKYKVNKEHITMNFAFIVMSSKNCPQNIKLGQYHKYGDLFLLTWEKKYNIKKDDIIKASVFKKGTWGEGRNHMYKYIVSNYGDKYDYYIFIDDDVVLQEVCCASCKKQIEKGDCKACAKLSKNPLEKFLNFLQDYEPAMSSTCQSWQYTEDDKIVNAIHGIDHLFLAFHKDAIHNFFPYITVFDSESWWYNGHIMDMIGTVIYNKYKLQYNQVRCVNISINISRRSYTQRAENWEIPYDYTFKEIKNEYKPLVRTNDRTKILFLEPKIKTTRKKDVDYKLFNFETFLSKGNIIDIRKAYYDDFPLDYKNKYLKDKT